MTDQELEQLTEEYIAQEHGCLGVKNRQYLIYDIIGFLEWLTKTHCIVSREKVQKHHKDYAFLSRKHPKASERHLSEIIIKEIEDLFGKELFEERSDK
ncbi:MAG: hypothetical protein HFJ91_00680 [Muribaculaceae bacterium]|nr:hypothetical protein [Muribaculaceae bacterium]